MQPEISCDKSMYVNDIFDELLQLFNGALKSNIVNQYLSNISVFFSSLLPAVKETCVSVLSRRFKAFKVYLYKEVLSLIYRLNSI